VSFADLSPTWNEPNYKGTKRYFMLFGNQTPTNVMPRTGTASYSGVVAGAGQSNSQASLEISGTSKFTADFAAESLDALLTLYAKPTGASSSPALLGTFDYVASTGNNVIWGGLSSSDSSLSGQMSGHFYGPNAEEIGVGWTLDQASGDMLEAGGVAVGKRN
jgi:hypothetical protein